MNLMRNSLKALMASISSAHAGLLIQRGLTKWEEGEKPVKKKLIGKISVISPDDLYLLAFNRWLINTYNDNENNLNFANVCARIDGRLYTGLSTGSTLETGATTHHSYAMPMLAGSSIKGAVRSYTEQLFAKKDEHNRIVFTAAIESNRTIEKMIFSQEKQDCLNILFGSDNDEQTDDSDAGYITWHDAWWIPDVTSQGTLSMARGGNKPFASEVITVHQEQYYQGVIEQALDMESPVPNEQIAIQGAFYFALEGEKEWVSLAKKLLEATLQHQGLGAKGSSGYGYFLLEQQLDNEILERYNRYVAANFIPDPNDEYAALKEEIKRMETDSLIICLSKDKNKFFEKFDLESKKLEHCQLVTEIALAYHQDTIASWKEITDKNTARAYKFIQKNSKK